MLQLVRKICEAVFYGNKTVLNPLDSLQSLVGFAFDAENDKWQDEPDYGQKKTDHPQHDHETAKNFHTRAPEAE
jgi:hypothetical protein